MPDSEGRQSSVEATPRIQSIVARLDRLPRRAVSYAATGITGLALFEVFYCNFDINVSYIQTCAAILPGCTPTTAQASLTLPVCLFLLGYLVGGLFVAPRSDRLGRRPLMLVALGFAVVGSLVTALAVGYPMFVLGRAVTGVAMGTLLSVGNTYIGEVAPARARANYTAITFVLCAFGATCGIGLGLLLSTEAAPFPEGLPVALGGLVSAGWRVVYTIAVVVGVAALAAVTRLPESPRWLIEHDRIAEAERVVDGLEERARRLGERLGEPSSELALPVAVHGQAALRELVANPIYRRRLILLVFVWFTGYATVFGYSTGSTAILTSLHFTAPVAGMISAVGGLGFLVQGLFSARYSEHLERRHWLPMAPGSPCWARCWWPRSDRASAGRSSARSSCSSGSTSGCRRRSRSRPRASRPGSAPPVSGWWTGWA